MPWTWQSEIISTDGRDNKKMFCSDKYNKAKFYLTFTPFDFIDGDSRWCVVIWVSFSGDMLIQLKNDATIYSSAKCCVGIFFNVWNHQDFVSWGTQHKHSNVSRAPECMQVALRFQTNCNPASHSHTHETEHIMCAVTLVYLLFIFSSNWQSRILQRSFPTRFYSSILWENTCGGIPFNEIDTNNL